METTTKEENVKRLEITPKHVERGRQIRSIVQHDIVRRGFSFDQAVDELASFLGIEPESVKLAIAIANDVDQGGGLTAVASV